MEHKAEVVDMTVGGAGQGQRDQRRHCIPVLQAVRLQRIPQPEAGIGREVLEEEQMDRNVSNDIDRGDLRQSLQNILANKVLS